MKQYLMEFIGTFFLLLAVATGNALAIGAMFAALIYVGWYLSGAHYNPAITTTSSFVTQVSREEYLYYIGAQILGALAGTAFWFLATGQQWIIDTAEAPLWLIILFEAVLTFFLCVVFLAMIDLFQQRSLQEYGLILGLALMAITFLRGTVNPAIVVGSWLFFMIMHGDSTALMMPLLGYIVGPFIGAWLAAQTHKYLHIQ